ncbi:MAG: hypothetical protein R3C56_40695 [Pirellulaceae bacterium]
MTQFLVRNLEDNILQKLRELAQSNGQSLEEFVRGMLRKVALERVATHNNLGSRIAARFAKIVIQEPIEELRGRPIAPTSFE